MKLVNPFECKGHWFKANLHAHTTSSDGNVSMKERVEQYKQQGYNILAITDHNVSNNVEGLSSEKFLVISGIEIDAANSDGAGAYDIVGLNVPYGFEVEEGKCANYQIDLVKQSNGQAIVAHPYWSWQ